MGEEEVKNGANPDNLYLEHDHSKALLFPHSPSPFDVQQYSIGDCYYLGVLSELAAKHPEKIKEMMRDNDDGTVTVRFFHRVKNHSQEGAFEPLYVTVNKIESVGQAEGALWVQVMERALAVSGLAQSFTRRRVLGDDPAGNTFVSHSPQPVPEDIQWTYEHSRGFENPRDLPWITDVQGNVHEWNPTYTGIHGASSPFSMQIFLGNEKPVKFISVGSGHGHGSAADVKPIPVDASYSSSDMSRINTIRNELARGSLVTCEAPAPQAGEQKYVLGINKNHVYSLLGVVEKEIDGHKHYFMKIRNPHGYGRKGVRNYQLTTDANGRQQLTAMANFVDGRSILGNEADSRNAISYVEFHDFKKEFELAYACEVKESSVERNYNIAVEEKNILKAYQTAFKEVRSNLSDAVHFYDSKSSEYKDMADALKKLAAHPSDNFADLKEKMSDLMDKVDLYRDHCSRVAGNAHRRAAVYEACRTLREIQYAADSGFARPKAYLKVAIAKRMVGDYEKELKLKPEDQLTPQEKSAKKLIETDPNAAVRNLMNSYQYTNRAYGTLSINGLAKTLYEEGSLTRNQVQPADIDNRLKERPMMTLGEVQRAVQEQQQPVQQQPVQGPRQP